MIAFRLPDPAELSIPEDVMSISDYTRGMVLVTGSAGSGKSTTMACLIDRINHTREGHIITLEDPLEYLHRHDRCIVSQREICTDTESYLTSLRATLRQSPDVILLGEMRDYETIQTAMTAAETGHLSFPVCILWEQPTPSSVSWTYLSHLSSVRLPSSFPWYFRL